MFIRMLLYTMRNPMKQLLTLIFLQCSLVSFSQNLNGLNIDESKLMNWISKDPSEYSGVYKFGLNESLAYLRIFLKEDTTIQVRTRYQLEPGGEWQGGYLTDNLAAIGYSGSIKFDRFTGRFVKYEDFGRTFYCVKVDGSLAGFADPKEFYELGEKQEPNFSYFGKYPNASTTQLDPKELFKMSSQELKIMRNEIFARYGYIFQEGGEMDKYFRQQRWYKPEVDDVNELLTKLEIRNIQLIRTEEQRP